jgi:hypothetical protein
MRQPALTPAGFDILARYSHLVKSAKPGLMMTQAGHCHWPASLRGKLMTAVMASRLSGP